MDVAEGVSPLVLLLAAAIGIPGTYVAFLKLRKRLGKPRDFDKRDPDKPMAF